MNLKQARIAYCLILLFVGTIMRVDAQSKYGEHQPYSSYWFIDELLKWDPETDSDASVYQIKGKDKIWLGKTTSSDYYIASLEKEENQKESIIQVISVAKDGSKSKASKNIVHWK
ncbi:GH85 family endohexosaminidase C-terminal domain-containing protein [Carboxylicivirga sp. N1Y90]|uniref:GH85 family endohexosaminidase C-terminal domain-containing protein n=1 Tax=Carboxylicivirga fragile TaxID=3417571 RepID=UPI003D346D92|nr:hypothetical protein [Marinilabiliaceae bacterium N1Y90]